MVHLILVLFLLSLVLFVRQSVNEGAPDIEYGIVCFGLFVGLLLFINSKEPIVLTPDTPVNSNCLKTVAHIDLSNRKDLKLIAADYANDVAYYEYVNPGYDVEINDTVYLVGGSTATVVSSDAVGFTVSSNSIYEGMSGTAVTTANGTQIGYISKRMSDGNYRCIWS